MNPIESEPLDEKKLEYANCELCDSENAKLVIAVNCQELVRGIFRIVKCRNCGLIYMNPRLEKEEIKKLYSQDYFKEFYSEKEQSKNDSFKAWLKIIRKHRKSGRLLDIGSGMGFFLATAKEKGWEVQGLEISPYATRYAKERFNLDVGTEGLEERNFPSAFFDVVTLWDVLEHVPHAQHLLQEVKRVLKGGGVVVIKVPNVSSPVNRTFFLYSRIRRINLVHVPTHLYHFTPQTLKLMLEKAGFCIEEVKMVDDPVERKYASRVRKWIFVAIIRFSQLIDERDSMIMVAKNYD